MQKKSSNRLTLEERFVGGALGYNFGGHWANMGRTAKESYNPEYCQKLIDFFLNGLQKQVDEPAVKIPPPHKSAFARSIGVATARLDDWEDLFTEFKEAVRIAKDIHCEMLLNGGLVGKYNPEITKLLLARQHDLKEDKAETPQLALIPMTVGKALNHLFKQQGLPQITIEEAEFEEVKPGIKADPEIAKKYLNRVNNESHN